MIITTEAYLLPTKAASAPLESAAFDTISVIEHTASLESAAAYQTAEYTAATAPEILGHSTETPALPENAPPPDAPDLHALAEPGGPQAIPPLEQAPVAAPTPETEAPASNTAGPDTVFSNEFQFSSAALGTLLESDVSYLMRAPEEADFYEDVSVYSGYEPLQFVAARNVEESPHSRYINHHAKIPVGDDADTGLPGTPVNTIDQSTLNFSRDFIKTLGVCVHINAEKSDAEGNVPLILKSLEYIGLNNIRTEAPWDTTHPSTLLMWDTLADAGVNYNILMNFAQGLTEAGYIDRILNYMIDFRENHPGDILAVEGLNEANAIGAQYYGPGGYASGPEAAAAFQQALYTAIKSTPALADILVISPSAWAAWDDTSRYDEIGDLSQFSDFGNLHAYIRTHTPDAYEFMDTLAQWVKIVDGDSPFVVTETGYNTLQPGTINRGVAVPEDVQAKLTLNVLMNHYQHGSEMTFLYELFDRDSSDPTDKEDHFGLFFDDGTPKDVAIALHNFTSILSAESDIHKEIDHLANYTFNLQDDDIYSSVFYKQDGATDIVIWKEAQIWDYHNNQAIIAPQSQLTVTFDKVYDRIDLYDPLTGKSVLQTLFNTNQITVPVSDHPIIIELNGTGGLTLETEIYPDHLSISAYDFLAEIIHIDNSDNIQSITLTDSDIITLPNLVTLQELITNYTDTLSKITNTYHYEVNRGSATVPQMYHYDTQGDEIYHTLQSTANGYVNIYGTDQDDYFIHSDISSPYEGYQIYYSNFSVAEGDKIDISDLLSGYDPLHDAINDFVRFSTLDGTTERLQIDADGGGDNFVTIGYIKHTVPLDDIQTLVDNGHIIL